MVETILMIWVACLLIVFMYHLFIFRVRTKSVHEKGAADYPGVSIVIAVKNGTKPLKKHLSTIVLQEYPVFEVLVVDDQSDPAERKSLEEWISILPKAKFISSSGSGKKHALQTGIEFARYDYILFTDADCVPLSVSWIKNMMDHHKDHDIVLGYSPYQRMPGLLNQLIRFETVMTGIQYLSWAMIGRPYMAVGRNILYRRSLLISGALLTKLKQIPYGDDDVGLQSVSDKAKAAVNFDPPAHVLSIPPATWKQWLNQKHRHLSAAHHYKPDLWWQPGFYGIALTGQWILLPVIMISGESWFWLFAFLMALLIRWINYHHWTKKLGDRDTVPFYGILELMYVAYLAIMGAVTFFSKKKTWN